MDYVEMVVKVIKDKGYNITQNPYKTKLKKECDNQIFLGVSLEFEYKSFWGIRKHKIFISNKEDSRNFHNGSSVLGARDLPSVIWFKEVYDEITRVEYSGLLI